MGGGACWGLLEAEKPLKIYVKTEKPIKIAENHKTAKHNDQNSKFKNLKPLTLDTTTKYSYMYVTALY